MKALARRSPVPVNLTVRVAAGWRRGRARGVLTLSVRDDGVGGADPYGSGLTGLRSGPKRSAAR